MLGKYWIVAVAALGMLFAGTASASMMTVDYTLVPSSSGTAAANTSHFDATSPTTINNMAPITGSASITYEVSGGAPVNGGQVTVNSLTAFTNLGAAGFGGAAIGLGGGVTSTLVSPVTTTQSGGTLVSAAGTLHLSGTVTCSAGSLCTFLGVPASTTLNSNVAVTIGGSGDLTYFTTTQPLTIALGSFTSSGNAVLYGTQSSISSVPEPSTLLLLGTGIAGLAAAGRRRPA